MRKQVRMVRISFFIAAVLIVGAFYAGFYFGDVHSESVDLTAENTAGITVADAKGEDSDEKEQDLQTDAVESMTTLSPDKYYLKENGGYLSVYKGTSTAVYFDTDIKADELPDSLKERAKDGIEFDDLASVYEFLENYSS